MLGWICFDSSNCGATVSRNPATGQLSGYILSELAGWIDVGQVYLKNDSTMAGFAQSELFGWINFGP